MRFTRIISLLLIGIISLIHTISATPLFNQLFGGYNSGYGGYNSGYGGYNSGYGGYGNNGYRPRPRPTGRQGGGRSYNDICRVINADSYSNPRGGVFPAQPFCPYTS